MSVGALVKRGKRDNLPADRRYRYGLITDIDGTYCWVFWPQLASDNFDGFKWCELKDLEVICEAG